MIVTSSEKSDVEEAIQHKKVTSFWDYWRWLHAITLVGLFWYLAFSGRVDFPIWVYVALLLLIASLEVTTSYGGLRTSDQERIRRLARSSGATIATNWPAPTALAVWCMFVLVSFFLMEPDRGSDEMSKWLVFCAQAGAASFLAAGLIYTHRSSENSRRALDHQRRTSEEQLTRQLEEREDARRSEQNERFFNAVELLGERDNEGAHIGALFSLEQLANESDAHYHQVIEAISAFVRSRSDQFQSLILKEGFATLRIPSAPHDIQVAMTVLGRRRFSLGQGERQGLNLRRAYLAGINFVGGDFQSADFIGATLDDSQFRDTNFARVDFEQASLQNTIFLNCIFVETLFVNAVIKHALIYFVGSLPDPYAKVAVRSTMSVGTSIDQEFSRPEPIDIDEEEFGVNCGRYMENSLWIVATVDGLSIDGPTIREGSSAESIDLSLLKGMSATQWDRINKLADCTPPIELLPDRTFGKSESAPTIVIEPRRVSEKSSSRAAENRVRLDQSLDSKAVATSTPFPLRRRRSISTGLLRHRRVRPVPPDS